MQEKIEFPKFTVPGQTNWVKWVLLGVGGLVAVSGTLFAVALAKRQEPAPAVVAAKPADVPLAPSATPRPVRPTPALAAVTTTHPETTTASDDAPAPVKAASHRPRHRNARPKSLARATAAPGKPSNGKPDAIDELLKKFK